MTESITYSVGYKRSLPNYENVTPFFSMTTTVGEDETAEEAKQRVVETVEGWLTEKIAEIDADLKR